MVGGTHNIVDSAKENIRTYPCFRLDDFNLQEIDFIKVDVEGFEKRVLLGAENLIKSNRPLIVIEQNGVTLPGEGMFDARDLLVSWGYRQVATCHRGWDLVMKIG